MQPIVAQPAAALADNSTTITAGGRGRRRGYVNYADPGSGDEYMDAGGVLDSDDSDFAASGGLRTTMRQAAQQQQQPSYSFGSRNKYAPGMTIFNSNTGASVGAAATPPQQQQRQSPAPPPPAPVPLKSEPDRSYLGEIPPEHFIRPRAVHQPTTHIYPEAEKVEANAAQPCSLIPIRVEFETDTHRIRDCFAWNYYEQVITPEAWAKIFCTDLDLPSQPWADTVANQIKAQIEEWEVLAGSRIGMDGAQAFDEQEEVGEEVLDCRVILSVSAVHTCCFSPSCLLMKPICAD